jgi:hypothetical protein
MRTQFPSLRRSANDRCRGDSFIDVQTDLAELLATRRSAGIDAPRVPTACTMPAPSTPRMRGRESIRAAPVRSQVDAVNGGRIQFDDDVRVNR